MIHCVILCGGSGTRLWPLSTQDYPKQFIHIGDKSLFDRTVDRFEKVCDDYIIVTNEKYKNFYKVNPDINDSENICKKFHYVFEPYSNDTGVAVLRSLENLNNNDIVIITPSDHYVDSEFDCIKDIQSGIDKINEYDDNLIVLFGIKPTSPETKYGYIMNRQDTVTFKEKPNEQQAKELIQLGALWNSGICVSRVKTLRKAFKTSRIP